MTTTQTSQPGFSTQTFEAFLATREEPDWLTERRRQAFELFLEKQHTELPAEEYRRVDLRSFRPEKYTHNSFVDQQELSLSSFSTLLAERAEFGGRVVHVDSQCRQSELAEELQAKGVVFGSLNELLKTHEELIKTYLMTQCVAAETDRFSAWHAAFWTDGTVLYVPRGVRVDQPLYSLIAQAQEFGADFSHTLVILEDAAEATLLEETCSHEGIVEGAHIGAVELIVGAEAHLRYVQLQDWAERHIHIAHQRGRVGQNGRIQWTVGALGSRIAHIHQDVDLDAPGSEAQVNGITFASERQLLSFYTQQTHHDHHAVSDLLYKEVARDTARVIWRGMIKVDEAAQKTDGYQRSDALILSPDARVDAIPGLEIEADDVRCTHGATAGQVDQDQVLYCMSRGVNRVEAMHLIVNGFFAQVFDRIPVEAVRETLAQAVERRLGFVEQE